MYVFTMQQLLWCLNERSSAHSVISFSSLIVQMSLFDCVLTAGFSVRNSEGLKMSTIQSGGGRSQLCLWEESAVCVGGVSCVCVFSDLRGSARAAVWQWGVIFPFQLPLSCCSWRRQWTPCKLWCEERERRLVNVTGMSWSGVSDPSTLNYLKLDVGWYWVPAQFLIICNILATAFLSDTLFLSQLVQRLY